LPLHHTFGWTAGVLCMLHIGSRIGINSSLKNVTRDMMFYKPTQMCLVPLYLETMYKRIWEQAAKQRKSALLKMLLVISRLSQVLGIDLRPRLFGAVLEGFGGRLRLVICGGAPLDAKYVKGFRDFGIQVLNGYGLTECAPIVTANRNDYYRDDSIGLVLPGCQVMIDNPDANGEGELLIKGPNVMLGYYNNPQATAATMTGGWLRTGDIGRIDAEGFVYITGRIKNMIKLSSGINIYPEELEMLIMNIPLVKEVIVYGQTVAGKTEPMLFAEVFLDKQFIESHGITNPEKYLEAEIKSINAGLPYYKKIGQTTVRTVEFDKTTTRKIKRFKIVH
ncbi:MAG: AMP-binding protein, partial [Syntrophomonadaceae bacterium]